MGGQTNISDADRRFSVSVLGLGPKTGRLQDGGLCSVGDVLDDAADDFRRLRLLPALGRRSIVQVRERLGAVLSCTGPSGEVNWGAFDQLCGLAPADEAAVASLTEADRERPIQALHLGARTRRLMAGGLVRAGDLADDRAANFVRVRNAPRLGEAAVILVERRLRTLNACRSKDGGVDWTMFDAVCTGQVVSPSSMPPRPPPPPPPPLPRLSAAARTRPVEVFRLGPKAKFLRQAGLSTVGHLQRDGVLDRLSRLAGVGRTTADTIRERMADLEATVDAAGNPPWDEVAARWGYPVTPDHPLPAGETFLDAAPVVIARWIEAHDNAAHRLVLSERLVRSQDGRLKLDELGRRLGLTRERVRQIEKKLLDGLCASLLDDDQSRSPVQFSMGFREWWERAAETLAATETLTWLGFVSGLQRAWGVPVARLTPILPLALAVLTDGGQVVPPRVAIPPRLLEPLPPALLRKPLSRLPTGRALADLEAAGCASFGGLLLVALENRLPQGRSGAAGARILSAVADALDADGALDPLRLAAALDLPVVPAETPETPDAFLSAFNVAVETSLGHGRATSRAADIWRVRTRHPAAERPTLEETAALLETWGPTIKREETLLLAHLNAQLVEGDVADAGVIWREPFLARVAEASRLRDEASGDFDAFIERAAAAWDIRPDRLRPASAGLWAVLSLYPEGRRTPVRRSQPAEGEDQTPAPAPEAEAAPLIVLRGFRRAH